jgi:hypothetical protein
MKGADTCWQQVGAPVPASGPTNVALFQLGERGKARFDDYCR